MIDLIKYCSVILLLSLYCMGFSNELNDDFENANNALQIENFTTAEKLYNQVYNNDVSNNNNRLLAIVGLAKLSLINAELQKCDSILTVAEQVITSSSSIDKKNRLQLDIVKANLLRSQSKPEEALTLHKQIVTGSKKLNDKNLLSVAYLNAGIDLENIAQYVDAKNYIDSATIIYEEIYDTTNVLWANLFNWKAVSLRRLGDLQESIKYFEKGAQHAKLYIGRNSNVLSEIYINETRAHQDMWDYEKASISGEKALTIARNKANEKNIASALYTVGVNYFYLGDFGRSKNYIEECVGLRKDLFGEDNPSVGFGMEVLGIIQNEKGDLQGSIATFKQALQIFIQTFGANHVSPANTQQNLAIAYLKLEEIDSAKAYIKKSNLIFTNEKGNLNTYKMALNFFCYADVFKSAKEFEEANNAIKKGYAILENMGIQNTDFGAAFLVMEAEIMEGLNLNKEANTLYKNALNILSLPEGSITKYRLSENTLVAINNYIDFLYGQYQKTQNIAYLDTLNYYNKDFNSVINSFRKQSNDPFTKSTVALKSSDFFQQSLAINYQLYKTNNSKKYKDEIFHISELGKATLLMHLIDDYKVRNFANLPASLVAKEDSIKELMTDLSQQLYESTDNDSLKSSLFKLKETYNKHIEECAKNYPEYHRLKFESNQLNLEEITEKLVTSDNTIIEYFLDDTAYYAIIINKENSDITYLGNKNTVNTLVNEWKSAMSKVNFNRTQSIGKKLYELLWQPFEDNVKTEVIIIPTGTLYYLSFEALPNLKAVEPYLLQSHSFLYGISLNVLAHQFSRKSKSGQNSIIIAPGFEETVKKEYKSNLPEDEELDKNYLTIVRQPWSLKMAKELHKKGSSKSIVGSNASETNIKKDLNQASIIHFATHAISDEEDPLRSKLILAKDIGSQENDGYLHAYELFNLSLQTELAILSACESGIGNIKDGEGMISLAYSMNYAGCPSVAMSLWKIDEKSNAKIIQDFYRQLNTEPSKSRALRQAKLNYINNHAGILQHPFYWSGLVLMGNNDTISLDKKRVNWEIAIPLFGLIAGFLALFLVFSRRRKY